jgi:hypothetical protein
LSDTDEALVGIDHNSMSGGAYRGACVDCPWRGPFHYIDRGDLTVDWNERQAAALARAEEDADAHRAARCRA